MPKAAPAAQLALVTRAPISLPFQPPVLELFVPSPTCTARMAPPATLTLFGVFQPGELRRAAKGKHAALTNVAAGVSVGGRHRQVQLAAADLGKAAARTAGI